MAAHGLSCPGLVGRGAARLGWCGMTSTLVDQLMAVREEHGCLNAELLVDLAKDKKHPLHSRFEWDDKVAGHKYRLEQAGQLLRVTFKPAPGRPIELRAFMAVRGEETPRSEYVPTEEAFADPFLREVSLRAMKRDWKSFESRYKHHAEFADFIRGQVEGAAS